MLSCLQPGNSHQAHSVQDPEQHDLQKTNDVISTTFLHTKINDPTVQALSSTCKQHKECLYTVFLLRRGIKTFTLSLDLNLTQILLKKIYNSNNNKIMDYVFNTSENHNFLFT